MVGPTICPAANTTVNALMPVAQALCGRLCRTSAVVDATTDKNTPPNSRPEASTTGHAEVSAGSTVANAEQAVENRQRLPALEAVQQPRPNARRQHNRHAQQRVKQRNRAGTGALLAQERNHKRHVADVAHAKQRVARQRIRKVAPGEMLRA